MDQLDLSHTNISPTSNFIQFITYNLFPCHMHISSLKFLFQYEFVLDIYAKYHKAYKIT